MLFDSNTIDYSNPQNMQSFTKYAKLKEELDSKIYDREELHKQREEMKKFQQ